MHLALMAKIDAMMTEARKDKNALALSLKKHSGKGAEFVIEHLGQKDKIPPSTVLHQLSDMIKSQMSKKQQNEKFLTSVPMKIWNLQPLFEKALSEGEDVLKNVFNNTFDSDIHKVHKSQLEKVRKLLISLKSSPVREIGSIERTKTDNTVSTEGKRLYSLNALLRFVRFFAETGEEEPEHGSEKN